MLPPVLRIILLAGSFITFFTICRNVRAKKIQIKDSLFWVFLSLLLIVNAIFPGLASWCSSLVGFMSPSNFVFCTIIAVLLIKEFFNARAISTLQHKLEVMAEHEALRDFDQKHSAKR